MMETKPASHHVRERYGMVAYEECVDDSGVTSS
jgi:hypothetical protein